MMIRGNDEHPLKAPFPIVSIEEWITNISFSISISEIVRLFLLRRWKLRSIDDLDNETIEITEDTTNSFVHANPLINFMSDEDPFDKEFK